MHNKVQGYIPENRIVAIALFTIGALSAWWVPSACADAVRPAVTIVSERSQVCEALDKKLAITAAAENGGLVAAVGERGWILLYANDGKVGSCMDIGQGGDITLTSVEFVDHHSLVFAGHQGAIGKILLRDDLDTTMPHTADVTYLNAPTEDGPKIFDVKVDGSDIYAVGEFNTLLHANMSDGYIENVSPHLSDDAQPHLFAAATGGGWSPLVVGEQGTIFSWSKSKELTTVSASTDSWVGSLFGIRLMPYGAVAYGIEGRIIVLGSDMRISKILSTGTKEKSLYAATKLYDGRLLLGGERSGLVMIDGAGDGLLRCAIGVPTTVTALVGISSDRVLAFTTKGKYMLDVRNIETCPEVSTLQ